MRKLCFVNDYIQNFGFVSWYSALSAWLVDRGSLVGFSLGVVSLSLF